jgi:hypothetical protein
MLGSGGFLQTGSLLTTPGETLSGAVTLKCTGTGGASTDISQKMLTVEWCPNN